MARGQKPDLNKALRNVVQHPTAKNVTFLEQPNDEPNEAHKAKALALRPSGMSTPERKFWDATAPQMVMLGRLKIHYAHAYAEYCSIVIRMAKTKKFLDANEWTYETHTRNGLQIKMRPEVAQLNDDWRKWRSLVGEFGLAPAADRGMVSALQGDMFGDGWNNL